MRHQAVRTKMGTKSSGDLTPRRGHPGMEASVGCAATILWYAQEARCTNSLRIADCAVTDGHELPRTAARPSQNFLTVLVACGKWPYYYPEPT